MIFGSPEVGHLSPTLIRRHSAEVPRGVVVYLYHQTVGYIIHWQLAIIRSIRDIRIGSLHNQVADCIISTRSTHGIYEGLFV